MSGFHHIPILRDTVVSLLAPQRGGTFVDGTLGGGGHAAAAGASVPGGIEGAKTAVLQALRDSGVKL